MFCFFISSEHRYSRLRLTVYGCRGKDFAEQLFQFRLLAFGQRALDQAVATVHHKLVFIAQIEPFLGQNDGLGPHIPLRLHAAKEALLFQIAEHGRHGRGSKPRLPLNIPLAYRPAAQPFHADEYQRVHMDARQSVVGEIDVALAGQFSLQTADHTEKLFVLHDRAPFQIISISNCLKSK